MQRIFAFFLVFVICSAFATPVQVDDLRKGMSNFAREFHLECVKTKPGNVVVSPLSVSNVLALLLQASSGKTELELRRGLHVSGDKTHVADEFLQHRESLERNVGESTLSIANRIYVQQGLQLNKDFQHVAVSKFKSNIESLDFAESVESAQAINHFVEEKTHGKIHELITSDQLDSNTRSVLVNAIYFKGNWLKPFSKKHTSMQTFHISETHRVPVDFMFVSDTFNYTYLRELDATALEMEYANSKMSFVIVLPNERMGLTALETKLKNYDLTKITDKMHSYRFNVRVPKFKVEYEINLEHVLKNLGMTGMFSETGGLNGLLESGGPMKVSQVVHKATIEIDENGSEGSAATGSTVEEDSLSSHPLQFFVDHPFMFFIRETEIIPSFSVEELITFE